MFTDADLVNIVREITLLDRPFKRSFWLNKGFDRLNRRPDALLNYWKKRLKNDERMASIALRLLNRHGHPNTPHLGVTKQPYPPTKQMLGSFTKSMANWAKNGFKTVSSEQFQSRLDACKKCDRWDSAALAGTGRCKLCGCSTQAKLRLATEKCPIDKWGPVTDLNDSYEQPKQHQNDNSEPNPPAA